MTERVDIYSGAFLKKGPEKLKSQDRKNIVSDKLIVKCSKIVFFFCDLNFNFFNFHKMS